MTSNIMDINQVSYLINNRSISDQIQYFYDFIFKENSPFFIHDQKICSHGFQDKTKIFTINIIDTDLNKLCFNIHKKILNYMTQKTYIIVKKIDARNIWCAEFINCVLTDIFNKTMTVDIYSILQKRRNYVNLIMEFKIFKPGSSSTISMQDLLLDIYKLLSIFIETFLINLNKEKDDIIQQLTQNSSVLQSPNSSSLIAAIHKDSDSQNI